MLYAKKVDTAQAERGGGVGRGEGASRGGALLDGIIRLSRSQTISFLRSEGITYVKGRGYGSWKDIPGRVSQEKEIEGIPNFGSGSLLKISEWVPYGNSAIYGLSDRRVDWAQGGGGGGSLLRYVGDQSKYPGTLMFETSLMQKGSGVTLPFVTFLGPKASEELKQHEYGHTLQYFQIALIIGNFVPASAAYLIGIGAPSLYSAVTNPVQHDFFWTEKWADQNANWFLKK